MFDRLPNIRVVMGQLGGMFPFLFGRFDLIYELLAASTKNVTNEQPEQKQVSGILRRLRDYVGQVYADTHSMDQAAIQCALETLGSDRVLYGSDFPVTPAHIGRTAALDAIQSLHISKEEKDAILGQNALHLLGHDSNELENEAFQMAS